MSSIPNAPESTSPGQESNVKARVERVMDLVYRRKWVILACFVAVAAFAAYRTFSETPQYETSSIVMVDLARTGQTAALESSETDLLGNTTYRTLGTELYILRQSPVVRQRVRQRFQELAADSSGLKDSLSLGSLTFPPRGYVRFGAPQRDINALELTAASPNPREAALLANLYAEEYVRLTQDASRKFVVVSRESLEEQEAERRAELQRAEQAVAEFRRANPTISLNDGGTTLVQRIAELDAQRDNALMELEMRQEELDRIEQEVDQISPELQERLTSNAGQKLEALGAELVELEIRRERTLARPDVSEGDPALRDIDREIERLQERRVALAEEYREEIERTGGALSSQEGLAYVTGLKRQSMDNQVLIGGMQARAQYIDTQARDLEARLNELPDQLVELAWLERARLHAQQMYEHVVAQLQQVRITEESEPGYAYVLREANVPSVPVSPNTNRDIAMGLILGLLLGLGVALAMDAIDNRLYKPDDIAEHMSGARTLAVVPDLRASPEAGLVKGRSTVTLESGQTVSSSLVALHAPFSGAAEAYRQLRTMVCFGGAVEDPRVIAVSSANPSEGKTTTAANLAILLAQSGFSTLLVDGDLRRPAAASAFGIDPHQAPATFAGLLRGTATAGEGVPTVVEGLDLLPAGAAENPAELLTSGRLHEVIADLARTYHYIVIDTPPVLAATDATVLARLSDASMIICMAGKTKEADLSAAVDGLQTVGAHVVGIVLNKFRPGHAFGYRYRYDGYSSRGYYGVHAYNAGADRASRRRS